MIIETKEITTYKTVYVADDGSEFSSAEECKKYEGTARAVIEGKFSNTFGIKTSGPCISGVSAGDLYLADCDNEATLLCLKPKTQDELDTLNMFIEHRGTTKMLGSEYIGKNLIFYISYDDEYYFEGTDEDVKAKYLWNLEKIVANYIPKCGECGFYNAEKKQCMNDKTFRGQPSPYGDKTIPTTEPQYQGCYRFKEKDNDRD